jgi:hypothetical protein
MTYVDDAELCVTLFLPQSYETTFISSTLGTRRFATAGSFGGRIDRQTRAVPHQDLERFPAHVGRIHGGERSTNVCECRWSTTIE